MTRTGLAGSPWYRRLFEGVRKAWSWAQRRHLPGLVSVVALALLLIAERKLLKDVLHAQEGLRDALTDLKQTVHDELGAAQSALQDTRILEHDIRSKLDALHGGEFNDVPLLTRALKNELDAGVARARDVVSTIGAAGGGRKEAGSVVADLEMLSVELAEARRIATEVEQRARDADERLGGGFDGGTPAFPDVRARAARIADKLAEAEAMMFSKDPSSTGLLPAALGKSTRAQPGVPPSETFPRSIRRRGSSRSRWTGPQPASSVMVVSRMARSSEGRSVTSSSASRWFRPASTSSTTASARQRPHSPPRRGLMMRA